VQSHSKYPPNKPEAGENREYDEPEPEERVDLLVDDVERHDAEGIVFLYSSRWAVFMKGALGDL
jgi:phage baseplate assembly protein gpV